jgi:hypothetical protein
VKSGGGFAEYMFHFLAPQWRNEISVIIDVEHTTKSTNPAVILQYFGDIPHIKSGSGGLFSSQ